MGGFLFLLAATTATAILAMHEPEFYRRCAVPPGESRQTASNEFFVRDFVQFVTNFADGRGNWVHTFSQEQLNSFFEEDFVRFGDADHFRKVGITDPRIEFNDNQIRVGFRYGQGDLSTILSYDLNVWLAKDDVNAIAIEIQRRRAGALPVPSQQLFQELTEFGRKHNIDISWYRHNGNPVAIIKFQTDRQRPTAQLRSLEIVAGKVTLRGFSFDPIMPIDEK